MKSSSPPSRPIPGSAPKSKTSPSSLSANERGVVRRARKKTDRRRKSSVAWLGFLAATAVIGGAAFGVSSRFLHVKGIWREYKAVHARVRTKQVTLKALRAQLDAGRKRLAAFGGGSGRERALAENGFVRPGERILLFPPDKETIR